MWAVLLLVTLHGVSFLLWGCVGVCRLAHQCARELAGRSRAPRPAGRIAPQEVAVLIAARNEQKAIGRCIDAVSRMAAASDVFVASDGSTDDTGAIARRRGCNVLDIWPNRGKARALKTMIEHFAICDRYKAALILDADAEIDPGYLARALPLFDDPEVAAVAGHAIPKWCPDRWSWWSTFLVAYRVRLYKITQAVLRYGQTWEHANVSIIVPGFASMYRCAALAEIDIDAPGLIIEDFNMTFELHHKKLGKIAYSPGVRCTSQEPLGLRDYYRQVRRWYLGFWQTVRRHGAWPSLFWASLAVFVTEMTLQSLAVVATPVVLVWLLLAPGQQVAMWVPSAGLVHLSLADVVIALLLLDYTLSILICVLEKKPAVALYGGGFVLLRWIDALLFLYALPLAYIQRSDGRWVSPTRA